MVKKMSPNQQTSQDLFKTHITDSQFTLVTARCYANAVYAIIMCNVYFYLFVQVSILLKQLNVGS